MSCKRYPKEFKIEVVKKTTEKGYSVANRDWYILIGLPSTKQPS